MTTEARDANTPKDRDVRDQRFVVPPLDVEINENVRCSQVRRTEKALVEPIVGYAMTYQASEELVHLAYGRSADGSLVYMGQFDRHDDAVETILRCV